MKTVIIVLCCLFAGAVLGGLLSYGLAPQEPDPPITVNGMQFGRYHTAQANSKSVAAYMTEGVAVGAGVGLITGSILATSLDRRKATGR
jgi:Na+/proline symporter